MKKSKEELASDILEIASELRKKDLKIPVNLRSLLQKNTRKQLTGIKGRLVEIANRELRYA